MSMIMTYLERTIYGMNEYFRTDKTLVLLLVVLLYLWLKEKKTVDNKGNRLLLYVTIMTVILLIPVTAMIVVIYQTAFYDYAWAWSMVPIGIVLAYGAVHFWMDMTQEASTIKKVSVMAIIVFVLWLCGNQGTVQTRDDTVDGGQLRTIQEYATQDFEGQVVLWAPKKVMQEMRRQTGEIQLIYGKDMWDEKAGAYDYEAYSEAFMEAYEWMELVDMLVSETDTESNFAVLEREYQLAEGATQNTLEMLQNDVNMIVIPRLAAEMYESGLDSVLEDEALTVDKIYTEQYAVYLLK